MTPLKIKIATIDKISYKRVVTGSNGINSNVGCWVENVTQLTIGKLLR